MRLRRLQPSAHHGIWTRSGIARDVLMDCALIKIKPDASRYPRAMKIISIDLVSEQIGRKERNRPGWAKSHAI